MRAVVQRVSDASVRVDDRTIGSIGRGLLILLGVGTGDTSEDSETLARKIVNLRIFPNQEGKMDLSVKDIEGDVLVVSQFTLYGDCSKGRRPNFTRVAAPTEAESLYKHFCSSLRFEGIQRVETGEFGAMMQVFSCNDGPVTLIVESPPERAI